MQAFSPSIDWSRELLHSARWVCIAGMISAASIIAASALIVRRDLRGVLTYPQSGAVDDETLRDGAWQAGPTP